MKVGSYGLYRKIKDIFGKKVDQKKFWLKKGKTYLQGEIYRRPLPELPEYLKKISFNSVLEFGCGAGKLTKLILDNFKVNNYVAFDLSPDQIHNARSQCKNYQVNFQTSTIQKFTTNEKFDLVIGSAVLQHIPPSDIKAVIQHLLSFTKKHFIHIDTDYSGLQWKNYNQRFIKTRHKFRHDWIQIYRETNLVESVNIQLLPMATKVFTMISIFHVTIKQA